MRASSDTHAWRKVNEWTDWLKKYQYLFEIEVNGENISKTAITVKENKVAFLHCLPFAKIVLFTLIVFLNRQSSKCSEIDLLREWNLVTFSSDKLQLLINEKLWLFWIVLYLYKL